MPPLEEEEPSSFFLRVRISEAIIRSSSCLDLDSPMALISSKNSFDRCIPDMMDNNSFSYCSDMLIYIW